jgi:hypothetical protein
MRAQAAEVPDARIFRNPNTTTRALVVSVFGIWLAAAVLANLLPPQLAVQPELSEGAGDIRAVLGAFALIAAVLGALELGAVAIIWRMPRSAVGRVVRLTGGVLMTITGLLLLNGGALQSPQIQWTFGSALLGVAVVADFTAAGLLASAAPLFSDLPGASIAERMTVPTETQMGAPRRDLMLMLTAVFIVAWIWTMATLLRTHRAEPFDAMQFLMPFLAGALSGAWRTGMPKRLATLGLAAGAGAASSWLFLVVIILGQYYRFNLVEYVFWWGLTGALLGTIGYCVWLFGRRVVRIATARILKMGQSHA